MFYDPVKDLMRLQMQSPFHPNVLTDKSMGPLVFHIPNSYRSTGYSELLLFIFYFEKVDTLHILFSSGFASGSSHRAELDTRLDGTMQLRSRRLLRQVSQHLDLVWFHGKCATVCDVAEEGREQFSQTSERLTQSFN